MFYSANKFLQGCWAKEEIILVHGFDDVASCGIEGVV
jgi:hypothetical protein